MSSSGDNREIRLGWLVMLPSLLVLLTSVSCVSMAAYNCGEYRSPEMRSQPTQPLGVANLNFDNGTTLQVFISKESFIALSGQWANRSPYMWRRYCAGLSKSEIEEISGAWDLIGATQQEYGKDVIAHFEFADAKIAIGGVAELHQDRELRNAVRLVLQAALRSFPKRFGKDISAHPLGPLVEPKVPAE